jgi:DNA recombination protein RmuC
MPDSSTLLLLIGLLVVVAVVLCAIALSRLSAIARDREAATRDAADLRTQVAVLAEKTADFERDLKLDLGRVRSEQDNAAATARTEISAALARHAQTTQQQLTGMAGTQNERLAQFADRLGQLTTTNEQRLEGVRVAIEQRLDLLRNENAKKLDEMRSLVDEKLQATLEQRLGESFRHVSDRLEQVHKGLGEMQTLASGVGDLKKVLVNVKSRGGWGEVQLGSLLAEMLTPAQYAQNVATRPESRERVEFAIRLPGRSDEGPPCWLPIDAKFPLDDYQRLQEALERADMIAAETCRRALDAFFKSEARTIREKYVEPPYTTDFAILFVPTEGLYAEAISRAGLADTLQRDYKVMIAGPSNLAAMLNALQLGFRTLAIERRSTEVWRVLGAVKTEFGKFGDLLARTKEKLDQVGQTLDDAGRKSTTIARKLRDIEAMPEAEADRLLSDNTQAAIEFEPVPETPDAPRAADA